MRRENKKYEEEMEEIFKFGHYEEGGACLLMIGFRTQTLAGVIIGITWRLSTLDEYM